MNFSRVYVWLGRRGGERPPVKRVRCLCVFVGGWPQQAARGLICLCDGWLGTLFYVFDGRRTNEIDIHCTSSHTSSTVDTICTPSTPLAHPLPSSTSTNTHRITPSTTSSSTHDGNRSLSRDSFRVSFSPKNNNTFNYFRRNNIILPTPTFPPRIEIINSRLNTAGGQFFHRLCCRCTRFAGPIVSSSAFECLQYWLLVLYLWSIPYTM